MHLVNVRRDVTANDMSFVSPFSSVGSWEVSRRAFISMDGQE